MGRSWMRCVLTCQSPRVSLSLVRLTFVRLADLLTHVNSCTDRPPCHARRNACRQVPLRERPSEDRGLPVACPPAREGTGAGLGQRRLRLPPPPVGRRR